MPLVHLKTKRLEYKFSIESKYTFVSGDSGTGKTTLYELVAAYAKNNSVASCLGYDKLIADKSIHFYNLQDLKEYIIFLDESSSLLQKEDLLTKLELLGNYFVIFSRDELLRLKKSATSTILEMEASGKFHTLVSKDSGKTRNNPSMIHV